jgi:hypothetical protein
VQEALTNDGTHEDDCPYSNDCFNTDCDYCSPIREQREKETLTLLANAQGVGVVAHVHSDNGYRVAKFVEAVPVLTQLYAAIQGDSNEG